MHISFLTPEYPSPKTGSSGGLGTSIVNLAQALIKSGVRVSIFIYGQNLDEFYVDEGIYFYRIKNVRVKGLSWWLTRKKIEKVINQAIKKEKIDLLEVPDWTGISAWMSIDCPVVMRLHGSDTYFCHLDSRPVKRWNKFQEKIAFRQADAIIAVSDFVGKKTNEVFGLNRPYKVIPNSVDISKFIPSINENQKPYILYFGTLIRKKGVLEIPAIFNRVIEALPEAKLILVGGDAADIKTGSNSTWALMQPLFSEKAFAQVHYLGKKPYDEIQHYIKKAAVCIFPSYAEALPVSWLEAMALSKAIVASDIGWAKEMLEPDKEAFLIHPNDHLNFANAILELLKDGEKAKSFGKAAQNKVAEVFSSEIVAENNIKFFKSITLQSN